MDGATPASIIVAGLLAADCAYLEGLVYGDTPATVTGAVGAGGAASGQAVIPVGNANGVAVGMRVAVPAAFVQGIPATAYVGSIATDGTSITLLAVSGSPNLTATLPAGTPLSFTWTRATTGTGTAGAAVIPFTKTAGLQKGMVVTGDANIPAGAYIIAVTADISITLNTNITPANITTGTVLSFGGNLPATTTVASYGCFDTTDATAIEQDSSAANRIVAAPQPSTLSGSSVQSRLKPITFSVGGQMKLGSAGAPSLIPTPGVVLQFNNVVPGWFTVDVYPWFYDARARSASAPTQYEA